MNCVPLIQLKGKIPYTIYGIGCNIPYTLLEWLHRPATTLFEESPPINKPKSLQTLTPTPWHSWIAIRSPKKP